MLSGHEKSLRLTVPPAGAGGGEVRAVEPSACLRPAAL